MKHFLHFCMIGRCGTRENWRFLVMFHVKHFKNRCLTTGFSHFHAVSEAFRAFLSADLAFFEDFLIFFNRPRMSGSVFLFHTVFIKMFHVKHFDF